MQNTPSVCTSRWLISRRLGGSGVDFIYAVAVVCTALLVGSILAQGVGKPAYISDYAKIWLDDEHSQKLAADIGLGEVLKAQLDLPGSMRYQNCLKGLMKEFVALNKMVGSLNEKEEIVYTQDFLDVRGHDKMNPEQLAYSGVIWSLKKYPSEAKGLLNNSCDCRVIESSSKNNGYRGFVVFGNEVKLAAPELSLKMGPPEEMER